MTIFGNIDVMARALDFHVDRQNTIAANIANVDTPGYAPKELVRPESATEGSFSLDLAASDGNHMGASGAGSARDWDIVEEYTAVPGNESNYVSLEHEMSRLSANTIKFNAVAKMVSKQMGILHYAARGGR